MISFDRSDYLTIVVCDECPDWAEPASSDAEARRIAADHEERAHGEVYLHRRRRSQWAGKTPKTRRRHS